MSPEASIVRVLAWLSKRFALALRGAVSRRLNEPQNRRKRALASHVGKVRKKFSGRQHPVEKLSACDERFSQRFFARCANPYAAMPHGHRRMP